MAWPVSTRATDDLITAAIWNADIVANLNAVARPIPKTADESVTSSTTLQNDDHLLFAMAANEYYAVHGVLWTSNAGEAGHLKFTFTVPASATYMMSAHGGAIGGSDQHSYIRSASDVPSWFSAAAGSMIEVTGVVVCAGTAGNFQFQWAQNTSNGTATVMKKGSHLLISKLG